MKVFVLIRNVRAASDATASSKVLGVFAKREDAEGAILQENENETLLDLQLQANMTIWHSVVEFDVR